MAGITITEPIARTKSTYGAQEALTQVASEGVLCDVGSVGVVDAEYDEAMKTGLGAFILANELKAALNTHAASGTAHTTTVDNVNFPITEADASTAALFYTLLSALILAYGLHDDDAELGVGWAYHAAQEAEDHSLASTTITTQDEAIAVLNDLKAKANAHIADLTAHGAATVLVVSEDAHLRKDVLDVPTVW